LSDRQLSLGVLGSDMTHICASGFGRFDIHGDLVSWYRGFAFGYNYMFDLPAVLGNSLYYVSFRSDEEHLCP
jgi:hypothetical protein